MILMVVDGQGGGIGAAAIKRLRETFGNDLEIYALGTNAIATSKMMKAGANKGASGENAIARTVHDMDVIVGPLGIIMANAMMGELTTRMAEAIASCKARKILIPLTQENISIAGISSEPLPHLLEQVVDMMKEMINHV